MTNFLHDPRQTNFVGDSVHVKILLIVFGIGVGFLIPEIVLRNYNPFGFRMRGNTIVLPVNQKYVIEDPNFQAFDKLDKRVTHTKNSLGFRGPEPPSDFSQRLTILTVGGSTTECFYLSDDQAWPALLEARLKPSFQGLWLNNAGLDGHSTFGHIVLVRDYISKLRPKTVLFLVGINDLFADGPRTLDRMDRNPLIGSLADHSELVALILNLVRYKKTASLKSLGAMPKPPSLNAPDYIDISREEQETLLSAQEKFLPEYQARLELLLSLTRGAGIEPVLITQPALFGDTFDDLTHADLSRVSIEIYRTMNGHTAWQLLEKYNNVTRKVASEQGIRLIDLAKALPKSSRYFYDYIHYGKEGAAKVAEIVATGLCPMLNSSWPGSATGVCN